MFVLSESILSLVLFPRATSFHNKDNCSCTTVPSYNYFPTKLGFLLCFFNCLIFIIVRMSSYYLGFLLLTETN